MFSYRVQLLNAIAELESNQCGEVTFKLLTAIAKSTLLSDEAYQRFTALGFKAATELYDSGNMNHMGELEEIQKDPDNPRNWPGYKSADDLDNAIVVLVKGIKTYECDFWSSVDAGVTEQEARQVAANLIYQWMFDKQGCPEKVDGGIVESMILDLREIHEDPSTDTLDIYEG